MNEVSKKISKVAVNKLQLDLIRTAGIICGHTSEDIAKYKELLFVAFFNEKQVKNYERFLNLPSLEDFSLDDRKDRIIYTLLSKDIFTPSRLKEEARNFTNGEIEVIEDYGNYSFTIKFTSIVGIPRNLENFKNFISINKPAHLNFSIEFRYNTHGQLRLKNLTHGELKKYTHQQIFDTRIFND